MSPFLEKIILIYKRDIYAMNEDLTSLLNAQGGIVEDENVKSLLVKNIE